MSKQFIMQAQTALNKAGFDTKGVDGIFGKASLNAVLSLINNTKSAVEILDTTKPSDDAPKLTNYILSEASLQKLKGVKPELQRVVKRAIQISETDFTVFEAVRSQAKQAQNVKSGASQTMKSNHLTGDAVDLVPYVDGKLNWGDDDNWKRVFQVAVAMKKAAEELGVTIKWGGAWIVLNGKTQTVQQMVEDYKAQKRRIGKKPFMDGVHFELV